MLKVAAVYGVVATLTLLAGCSGGAGANLNPGAPPINASREAKGDLKIFISGSFPSSVYVLDFKGKVASTLTRGLNVPQGLATDSSGNLYVANLDAGNILVFKPPYSGAPKTIADDPGAAPLDVAIDDKGDLAVTNLSVSSGNGNVALYHSGATSPSSIVSSPNFQQPQYCAFDKHGNLFLDNLQRARSGNGVSITMGEIVGGVHGTSIAQLKTSSPIDTNGAGSIQVTTAGGIALDNYVTPGGQGGNIYTYGSPKHRDLGTPDVLHLTGSIQPLTFAFLVGDRQLVTADYSLDAAQVFTYPGGSLVKTFDLPSGQFVQGVAVYPTEQF